MPLGKALNFILSPLGTLVGGKAGKLITAAALITVGAISGNPGLVIAGIGMGASALKKKPKVSPASLDRLNATLEANAPRKTVVGNTAMATDVRYQAYTGSSQEYIDQIVACASHKVESAADEIWFDSELAWSLGGGAQGRFAGYLTVDVRNEGNAGNAIAIDSTWTSSCRLTGCAYLHLRYKLTGNSKKAESPFASSIPSRMTIRGKGALVPDPRLSSGAGGSGSQDMSNQASWAYSTAAVSGRNLACQVLFCLLGWKIGGKLAVGFGVPPARIDFASFIAGANICDESVALAAGGTEPRYRGDGIWSEDDDPDTVLTGLLQAMNAELTDESGKIALRIEYNDLAAPVQAFTEADILDGDDWRPSDSASDVNQVAGRYVDASNTGLYQMSDYPKVTLAGADYGSTDGIQRIDPFDLDKVQSPSQGQRLAKLRLQRKQWPGIFSARFNMKGWAASYGRVVTLSHASIGFAAKKFRVKRQVLRFDGSVELTLHEVDPSQYSWSAEEAAIATAAVPTAYDPLNNPLLISKGSDIGLPDNAGSTLLLTSLGSNLVVNGNGVVTTTDGSWSVFYSADTCLGAAAMSFRVPAVYAGTQFVVGLLNAVPGANGDPNGYSGHGWSFHANAGALYQYDPTGGFSATIGTLSAGDLFTVAIDNLKARFYRNGAAIGAVVDVPADQVWRAGGQVFAKSITDIRLSPYNNADFGDMGGATKPEANADVTANHQANVELTPLRTYEADYLGTIGAGLPDTISPRVTKGGVDIKTDTGTTYAIAASSGITASVDNTTGSGTKGDITVTALASRDGWIDLAVAVAGVAQPTARMAIHKNLGSPPAGGGSGSKVASTGSFTSITASSYARIALVGTVTVGSGESLYASAGLDYYISGTGLNRTATVKMRYAPTGTTTWTDIGTAATGTNATGAYNPVPTEYEPAQPGHVDYAQSAAPSAGTYDVEIVALENTAGRTMTFSGIASVEAKP